MVDVIRQMTYLKYNPGLNIRRYELLTVLVDFVEGVWEEGKDEHERGTHGPTPSELGWWKLFNSRAKQYGFRCMAYSTFKDHVRRLIDEGLISRKYGLICITDADWKRPAHLPLIEPKKEVPCP